MGVCAFGACLPATRGRENLGYRADPQRGQTSYGPFQEQVRSGQQQGGRKVLGQEVLGVQMAGAASGIPPPPNPILQMEAGAWT